MAELRVYGIRVFWGLALEWGLVFVALLIGWGSTRRQAFTSGVLHESFRSKSSGTWP